MILFHGDTVVVTSYEDASQADKARLWEMRSEYLKCQFPNTNAAHVATSSRADTMNARPAAASISCG
jgi:hypothetical protein